MPVTTPAPSLGAPCPPFRLPTVDHKAVLGLEDFHGARALLVVFTCNHCPYARAVEQRIIDLQASRPTSALQVVAICSNDAASYPDDAPERLAARAAEMSYPFPYLHDEDQSVARAFGAVCTPDFFLYGADRRLAYRGRLDDSWKDPSKVTRQELAQAVEALLAGRAPSPDQAPSMGCSIKWRTES